MSTRTIPADIIASAASAFRVGGRFVSAEPYGDGHINDTFLARYEGGEPERAILQRINTSIFTDPVGLMENIEHVTEYVSARVGDPDRESMSLIREASGGTTFTDRDGGVWRMTKLIDGVDCYSVIEDPRLLVEAGRAFGRFFQLLRDYPAGTLNETILKFHDTRKRFGDFSDAVKRDKLGRLKTCEKDVEFALAREAFASELVDKLASGVLPLRVTHNDTKINNVLIDHASGRAICVIDLDTVMPGLVAYDFGDAIRAGANTGAEDEPDLTKVEFSLAAFESFAEGYLAEAGSALTDAEIASLTVGSRMMTFECGMRFLADYLDGDAYFKTSRPGQNLDRARTQFKLVAEMERLAPELDAIVAKHAKRVNK